MHWTIARDNARSRSSAHQLDRPPAPAETGRPL